MDMPLFFELFWPAVVTMFLASLLSGVIGSYVVVKRLVFLGGAISHSVLGGIGLVVFLRECYGFTALTPIMGAFCAAIIASISFACIRKYIKEREDVIIGALWSFGMSLGLLLFALTPGARNDLGSLLTGSVLYTTKEDVLIFTLLTLATFFLVRLFHKKFVLLCFDEDEAAMQGVDPFWHMMLLLILMGVTIIFLIQVAGLILAVTMLSLPPAIANMRVKSIKHMMLYAVLINLLSGALGFALGFTFDLPLGVLTALLCCLLYLFALVAV